MCEMDEERDRFWLSRVHGHAYPEQRTAPVQLAARLKDKVSWDRERAEWGRGKVTKQGR